MDRMKRIYVLLGVLALVCVGIFAVSHIEERKEAIRAAGEAVLEVPTDSVTGFGWTNDLGEYSFSLGEDGAWVYEGDSAFPVSSEAVDEVLSVFEDLRADFVIEDVDDPSLYGLSDPTATITLLTDSGETVVLVGSLSVMDEERYVSLGGDTVYLAQHDPMDEYSGTYTDLIAHDTTPQVSEALEIDFGGAQSYRIEYAEDGGVSYSDDDVYYVFAAGARLPLDSDKVSAYLKTVRRLDLSDFADYAVSGDELALYGMDEPELDITIKYEDDDEEEQVFTLHISRDPEELAALAGAEDGDDSGGDAGDSGGGDGTGDEEEITAYARVGESQIVYRITADEYSALMAASYDELRHSQLYYAPSELVTGMEIELEGETYVVSSTVSEDGERTYFLGEAATGAESDAAAGETSDAAAGETDTNKEGDAAGEGIDDEEGDKAGEGIDDEEGDAAGEGIDIDDILDALEALEATEFTSERPTGQEEIALRVYLDSEEYPVVLIELYRYDGARVLAGVDGVSTALVARSAAVDLIEAVHALVL